MESHSMRVIMGRVSLVAVLHRKQTSVPMDVSLMDYEQRRLTGSTTATLLTTIVTLLSGQVNGTHAALHLLRSLGVAYRTHVQVQMVVPKNWRQRNSQPTKRKRHPSYLLSLKSRLQERRPAAQLLVVQLVVWFLLYRSAALYGTAYESFGKATPSI